MKSQSDVQIGLADALWNFFASLKLTIIVLLSLAVLSGIGTFMPQNQSPADYFRTFGPFWYQIMASLDLFDLYHAWWFRLLIVILVINIIICSVDRLQATWKIIFAKSGNLDLERFRKRPSKREFRVKIPLAQLQDGSASLVKKTLGGYDRIPVDRGFALTVDRGRWTRLGVYVVHLSVIVLLIGGLVGSIFGFDGYVNLPEDETIQAVELRDSGLRMKLPFALRCDDFKMQVYDTGAPKEWRVWLTILENNQPVVKKDIIVNDPLRYKGINIFLSSYGKLKESAPSMAGGLDPKEPIKLTFQSKSSGMIYDKTVRMNETVDLPEELGTLTVTSFEPKATYRNVEIGPTLIAKLVPRDGPPQTISLPLNAPKFDAMRHGSVIISAAAQVVDQEPRYYAGLQVTSDPGVGLVYAGFVLIITGCFITFFMSHRQVVVEIRDEGNRCRVMISGTANKNKLGLDARLDRLADRLKEL